MMLNSDRFSGQVHAGLVYIATARIVIIALIIIYEKVAIQERRYS